jgi:hypothetical protein
MKLFREKTLSFMHAIHHAREHTIKKYCIKNQKSLQITLLTFSFSSPRENKRERENAPKELKRSETM